MPSGTNLDKAIEHYSGPEGHWMIDLQSAEEVEVLHNSGNRLWVNVDGRCVLRIGLAETIKLDTPTVESISSVAASAPLSAATPAEGGASPSPQSSVEPCPEGG